MLQKEALREFWGDIKGGGCFGVTLWGGILCGDVRGYPDRVRDAVGRHCKDIWDALHGVFQGCSGGSFEDA